jgi:hypothetical protein
MKICRDHESLRALSAVTPESELHRLVAARLQLVEEYELPDPS